MRDYPAIMLLVDSRSSNLAHVSLYRINANDVPCYHVFTFGVNRVAAVRAAVMGCRTAKVVRTVKSLQSLSFLFVSF